MKKVLQDGLEKVKSKGTKRKGRRPLKEENLTKEELAQKEKDQFQKEKHKSLINWLNKLEAMHVILISEDDIEM